MNNVINWEYIRYFAEVAKAGSVAKAAAVLGVSHATALRNISRFEQDLGIKLFDRHQSGYRITPQGEEILPNALSMEEHVDTLMRRATGRNPAPEGLLRLQVPDTSLVDLGPLIVDFRAIYPRIAIQTEQTPAEFLTRSKVDIALALTNTPPDEVVGRQIARIEFAYYAAPTYLDQIQGNKSFEPGDCDWVIWGSTATSDADIKADKQELLLRRHSKRSNIVMKVSNHIDALTAVRAGVGVGLLKKPQPELIEIPIRTGMQAVGLWILTHQELQRSGRVQAFMDFAVERYLVA